MKKILIVDDEKNFRISLSIGLTRKGYEVDVAGNALEALMKMKESLYDFMLTDIKMPKTNGIELAKQVAKFYPYVRIILMSAYDFRDYEKEYKGVSEYPKLSKPFQMKEMTETLNYLNDGYNWLKLRSSHSFN